MFHRKIVELFLTFPSFLGDQWIQFQRKKTDWCPCSFFGFIADDTGRVLAQEFDIPKGWVW